MKNFSFILLSIIIAFLQLSVVGVFFGSLAIPNLLLVFALSLVLLKGFDYSLKWLILASLIVDAGASWIIGTGTLLIVIISFLVGFMASIADIRSRRLLFWPSFTLLIAILTWAYDQLANVAIRVENYDVGKKWPSGSVNNIGSEYFIKIFFTVLAGYAVYYIVKKLDRIYEKPARIISRM